MSIPLAGFFKLRDVTHTTLVIPKMSRDEFLEKLKRVTDQTTNIGFLSDGKIFHGLVDIDRFKLKRLRTFRREEFTIHGEITVEDGKLKIHLEIVQGLFYMLIPKIVLFTGALMLVRLAIHEGFNWRHLPFILLFVFVMIVASEVQKQNEIARLRELLLEVIRS